MLVACKRDGALLRNVVFGSQYMPFRCEGRRSPGWAKWFDFPLDRAAVQNIEQLVAIYSIWYSSYNVLVGIFTIELDGVTQGCRLSWVDRRFYRLFVLMQASDCISALGDDYP